MSTEQPNGASSTSGVEQGSPSIASEPGAPESPSARLERPETDWQRVSPKYIVVDVVGYIIFGAIMTAGAFVPYWIGWSLGWILGVGMGVLFLLIIAFTPRRVRSIGYLLRDDDLLFRRGIMFQRFVAVPYGRMQLVDITRGPVSRMLGLAELKFVTAAASSGVLIPGLALETAEQLRDHLVAVAETRRAGL